MNFQNKKANHSKMSYLILFSGLHLNVKKKTSIYTLLEITNIFESNIPKSSYFYKCKINFLK